MPRNRSCGAYGPGHLMHRIQWKKSHEDGQPIGKVKVVAVHGDRRVEIEGDDLKLTLWYHDPDHLRSALCFGGRAEWKPKYHVLDVTSSPPFNLATLNKVEPCKPPIRRRPTETTRQFIERAMRENHGYMVPARWLADLDGLPDGDTGEPESGYLVGKLQRIQRCCSHCSPNHGRRDAADMAEIISDGVQYHVLPDDLLAALNILREAAGLEPWPAQGTEPK
jgi:hypothetical protein